MSWPLDLELLHWLRRMTIPDLYTFAAEESLARRWIGGDIFGSRRCAEPPELLDGVDVRKVPADQVASLLSRMSLAGPAAVAGVVTSHEREDRQWSAGAPPLPAVTRIPHVVHAIWLGSPLPETSAFWHNFAAGADEYAGSVDFVLWTDHPRGEPAPMLEWARGHGIHVVNLFEMFHARAPMTLHTPFMLELAQKTPQAYAAASDHLRVEVIHRFGGLYADGDLHLAPTSSAVTAEGGYRLFRGAWQGAPAPDGPARLPDLFERVARSRHGFTAHAITDTIVLNDVICAPASHPALALWIEGARYNYLREHRSLFAQEQPDFDPASWTWAVTPIRSGRIHQWLLGALGIAYAELVRPAPAIREHSELSWLPPVSGQPAVPSENELATLMNCVDVLRWQFLARSGDLCLSAVAPLIRGLPDPDTAWTALLMAFAELATDLGPVVSVTDCRRNHDGSLDEVVLPAAAQIYLERAESGESWFLDERTTPATLRPSTGWR